MTINFDTNVVADEAPVGDAVEQHQPTDLSAEDTGPDAEHLTDLIQRDAYPSDLIDQAITVPLPDDDRDGDPG
jgi:hypothetical protein